METYQIKQLIEQCECQIERSGRPSIKNIKKLLAAAKLYLEPSNKLAESECMKEKLDGCCCECKYQTKTFKHPWNKGKAKGSVLDTFGYVCAVPGIGWIYSDRKHGMCECFRKLEG